MKASTSPGDSAAADHGAALEAVVATDKPTLRLFALLEHIASSQKPASLPELVAATRLPKPTLHRMLLQLLDANLLLRESSGRYSTGRRLRRLAENLLMNDSHHGARNAVLRHLVDEVRESCNLTTLSGREVIYLDRVETAAPLRFFLHAGSRVPVHCSASGKAFLAQMTPDQRQLLLAHAPLVQCTANTITDPAELEREIRRVQRAGFAIDNEEFLPDLLCLAVLVPAPGRLSNLCVAVQAPIVRLSAAKARTLLPALQRAALALSAIDEETALLPARSRSR